MTCKDRRPQFYVYTAARPPWYPTSSYAFIFWTIVDLPTTSFRQNFEVGFRVRNAILCMATTTFLTYAYDIDCYNCSLYVTLRPYNGTQCRCLPKKTIPVRFQQLMQFLMREMIKKDATVQGQVHGLPSDDNALSASITTVVGSNRGCGLNHDHVPPLQLQQSPEKDLAPSAKQGPNLAR